MLHARVTLLLLLYNGPSSKTPIFFNMTFPSRWWPRLLQRDDFNAYMYEIYVHGICTIHHIIRMAHPFPQMGFRIKLRIFVRVKLKEHIRWRPWHWKHNIIILVIVPTIYYHLWVYDYRWKCWLLSSENCIP